MAEVKIDEVQVDIETTAKGTVSILDKLINKLSSLNKSSNATASTMKKVDSSIASTTNKFKSMTNQVEKASDDFANKLFRSLNIKPVIDTTGFAESEQELSKKADDIKKSITQTRKEAEEFSKKLKAFKESGYVSFGIEYDNKTTTELEKDLETTKQELDSVINKKQKFDEAIASSTQATGLEDLYKKSEQAGDKIGELLTKSREIESALAFKTQFGDMSFGDVTNQMDVFDDKIQSLKQDLLDLNAQRVGPDLKTLLSDAKNVEMAFKIMIKQAEEARGTAAFGEWNNALKNLEKISGRSRKEFQGLGDEASKGTRKASNGFKNLNKGVKDIKNKLSSLKNTLGKITSAFTGFGKKATGATDKLTNKLKKLGLGLLSVRTAMSLLTRSVNAYLSFDGSLQDSITNSWNMLGALLAPAIQLVADLFARATTYIYAFVKTLTGIDLVARANAKALDTQAKSTKGAANEAKKALAPFDELNNMKQESSSSGAGAGDIPQIEVPDIDTSGFSKLAAQIRELFLAGDYEGIGLLLGEKLTKALDSIPWDAIKKKAGQIGKGIAEVLNGFIVGTDFHVLGNTIAQGINTAIEFAYNFVTTFNFKQFGTKIGQGLYTALHNIDWKKLADTLSTGIKGVFDGLTSFLTEIDHKKIGEDIRTFFANIDWKGIWESIKSAIGAAFTGFSDFIAGLFNIDSDSATKWVGVIVGLGVAIPVIKGLLSLFKKFGKEKDTVKEGTSVIADSFGSMLKSFGKATEIIAVLGGLSLVIGSISDLLGTFADSSSSFAETAGLITIVLGELALAFAGVAAATNLMDWTGIAGAAVILGGFAAVIQTVSNMLNSFAKSGTSVNSVVALMTTIFGGIVVLMNAIATVGPTMTAGLLPFSVLVAEISAILIVMAATIPVILDACGKFISAVAPAISMVLTTIGDLITKIINALGKTLPPIINSVGSLFKTIFDGISKVIKTVGDTIVKILNTAKSLVTTVLNSILNFIDKLGPAINKFVDNAIQAVTKLVNFMVSGVEYLVNTLVIAGINSMIKAVNKIPLVDLPTVSKMSIPRFVPKLATGTNEIETEGIYHLHEGEAVVPKKYNPAVGGGYEGNNVTGEETNTLLRELIDLIDSKDYQPKIDPDDIGRASVRYIRNKRRTTGGSVI